MPDTPMPTARLDEISALADAATPGPWEAYYGGDRIVRWLPGGEFEYIVDEPVENRENAAFIAAARAAVPELIAEVRRARAESERRRVQLRDARNDLLEVRGHLSPNGYPQRVPMDISETVAPAVEWLLAENERLRAENAELEKRDDWLRSLEAAGVDNWEGIAAATEIHEREA